MMTRNSIHIPNLEHTPKNKTISTNTESTLLLHWYRLMLVYIHIPANKSFNDSVNFEITRFDCIYKCLLSQINDLITLTNGSSVSCEAVHLISGSGSRQWETKSLPSELIVSGILGILPMPTLNIIW